MFSLDQIGKYLLPCGGSVFFRKSPCEGSTNDIDVQLDQTIQLGKLLVK